MGEECVRKRIKPEIAGVIGVAERTVGCGRRTICEVDATPINGSKAVSKRNVQTCQLISRPLSCKSTIEDISGCTKIGGS